MSLAHNVRGFKTTFVLKTASTRGVGHYARKSAWKKAQSLVSKHQLNNAILSRNQEFANDKHEASIVAPAYDHNQTEPRITVLKDNFVTSKLPATCASLILEGFKGPQESTVGRLLDEAGILVVAKTNMDEFGMGSHSISSAYGAVQNGVSKSAQSAGGSSGGSAMTVADSMVRIAIGSDTGGSVRLPAAYTRTVGFKPSYGRISRNGLVPYANSLDTVGIIASTVLDVTAMYKFLDKPDPADPTCHTPNTRQRIQHSFERQKLKSKRADEDPEEPRIRLIPNSGDSPIIQGTQFPALERKHTRDRNVIGVPEEYNIQEMHPLVRQAWLRTLSMLSDRGYRIKQISLPTTRQALAAYYVLAPAEASSNLAKYDGVRYGAPRSSQHPDNHNGPLYSHYRGELFGDEVKRRILLGTFSLSAGAMDNYFIQAQKVRRLVQEDFNNVFAIQHPLIDNHTKGPNLAGVDFIIVPTAPTLPPLLSEVKKQSPLDSYINDVFTVPASLAGLPAVSVPVIATEDMLPTPDRNVGMQVIGQYGDDMGVLSFARNEIEAYMPVYDRRGSSALQQTRL